MANSGVAVQVLQYAKVEPIFYWMLHALMGNIMLLHKFNENLAKMNTSPRELMFNKHIFNFCFYYNYWLNVQHIPCA